MLRGHRARPSPLLRVVHLQCRGLQEQRSMQQVGLQRLRLQGCPALCIVVVVSNVVIENNDINIRQDDSDDIVGGDASGVYV